MSKRLITDDTLCITYRKGDEMYVLHFRPDKIGAALCTLARWAENNELSFTWADAAALGHRIREFNT